jgi:TetR/AcrR family transcriptional regulator, copper-responsive repressor
MTPNATTLQKTPRQRGRPRSFDPAATLKTIRRCFAKDGFSGTSVEDLSDATGLSPQSLYNAFGDKRTMFLQALDLEFEEVTARLHRLRDEKPSIDRLAAFVEAAMVGYDTADQTPGIAFGSALAGAPGDPEIGSRLRHFLSALDVFAVEVLGPAVPASMATLFSTLAIGLCLRSRCEKPMSEKASLRAFASALSPGHRAVTTIIRGIEEPSRQT